MGRWSSLRALVRELLAEPAAADGRPEPPVVPGLTRPEAAAAAEVSAAREALRHGDDEAARQAAAAAVTLAPREPCATFYLGQALLRQQRFDEARALFAEAVAEGDPFGLAATWLARLETAPGDEPWPRAKVSDAIELERAARAALRQNDPAAAEQLAREALAADPENLLARHHLGQALLAQGRRDEAVATFQAAPSGGLDLGLPAHWLSETYPAGEADGDAV